MFCAVLLPIWPGHQPKQDWVDAYLVNAARDIHADDPAFGHRFVADELLEKGITARREPSPAPVRGPWHLVGVLDEAWPEPEARATGSRRPGGARLHRRRVEMSCG